MFKLLLHKISAERVDLENPFLPPFFYQQQRAYSFCLQFIKNKKVLEIGSGSGYGTYRLAKVAKNVLGIDSDEIAIAKSKEKYKTHNLKFISSTIENFKGEDRFDCIIALQVFEHIEKPELFLSKIASVIKKDGFLIISTPNSLTQSYNENPYHYKEYSFTELRNILSKYFREINLYGLSGDSKVRNFEEMRKKHILDILKKDKFKLRRFISRRIKQLAFDLITFLNRALYQLKNRKLSNDILENNYKIIKENESNSIDIIAVCRHIK